MSKHITKLGFIGFGELSSTIAKGLKNEGLHEIWAFDKACTSDDGLAEKIKNEAQKIGIILVQTPEELVSHVNVIFSTVTAAEALRVAQDLAPLLRKGQIYADLNGCSPQVKLAAEKIIIASGASYVDVGVIGGAPFFGHKVPCLVCGTAAEELKDLFKPFGMDMRLIKGPIGQACRIKLLRSVVQKGLEALMLEMLIAAKEYDLEEKMMDSLAETFNRGKFKEYINSLITTHAIHAKRRLVEMEMAFEMVKESGVMPHMSTGTLNFFKHSATLELENYFKYTLPKDYQEVVAAIKKLAYS